MQEVKKLLVNLKSDLALLSNKSHNEEKSVSPLSKMSSLTYCSPLECNVCPYCLPPLSGEQAAIQSKAGAIECCKEIKITAPPNEWRNIPLYDVSGSDGSKG